MGKEVVFMEIAWSGGKLETNVCGNVDLAGPNIYW
jgi:hypothetical protein